MKEITNFIKARKRDGYQMNKILNIKLNITRYCLLFGVITNSYCSELPDWIINPEENGMICDIGSSKTNSQQSKRIAIISAKSNISKKINIYIENQTLLYKNNNSTKEFTTQSKQTSNNLIKKTFISDEYEDTKNHIYYVRICSKLQ